MKNYLITSGILRFGPGTVVGLSDDQAKLRGAAVEKDKKSGLYKATQALEFKTGEVVAVAEDDISKNLRDFVEATSFEPGTRKEVLVLIEAAKTKLAESGGTEKTDGGSPVASSGSNNNQSKKK